jgi:hypothetical protein
LRPFLFLFLPFLGEAQVPVKELATNEISECVAALSDAMLYDAVSPPAAARIYAYSMLGAYEVGRDGGSKKLPSMVGVLNHYYPTVNQSSKSDYQLSSLFTILEIGERMIPSGLVLLPPKRNKLIDAFRKAGFKAEYIDACKARAHSVTEDILYYALQDSSMFMTSLTRYSALNCAGCWIPTSPEYLPAVEPYWRKMRPFLIDSANQFQPRPPIPYNMDKGAPFFKMAVEVYKTGKTPTDEQKNIAAFWDCNPFAVRNDGHLAYGVKKITPGGHWMGITGIVAKQLHKDFEETLLAHTLVALTISDAFIACWDEKYRSNRIRPITVINTEFDPEWEPLLQTPPFPEYPSGHSVISTAASVVLSHLFGEDIAYTDDTETAFGLQARTFKSFAAAAKEASISRLYGGIHFRDAIEQGQIQGGLLGSFVIRRWMK